MFVQENDLTQLETSILKFTFFFLRPPATLPFNEVPAIVSEQRQKELEQRKEVYQWDWVSDDMPGNIKATVHGDLPRDVQFTDEKSRYFVYLKIKWGSSLFCACAM